MEIFESPEGERKTLKTMTKEYNLTAGEVVEMSKTSYQTLNNWVKDKPELLDIVLRGCSDKKAEINEINEIKQALDIVEH